MARAFSLIELVLVLAIMGVATAIAAPRYLDALARYRAQSAARQVVALLTLAQTRARQTSQTLTANFDRASGTVTLSSGGGNGLAPTIVEQCDLAASPYQAALTKVSFAGNEAVHFDGYGQPDAGGTIVVTSGDAQQTIVVDSSSGKASVQ